MIIDYKITINAEIWFDDAFKYEIDDNLNTILDTVKHNFTEHKFSYAKVRDKETDEMIIFIENRR